MNDLSKALSNFITRDIFYILSGLFLIKSIYLTFNLNSNEFISSISNNFNFKIPNWILIIGIAYVIGFITKEIFGLMRIINETHYFEPSCVDKFIYCRREKKKWQQPDQNEFNHHLIYKNIEDAGKLVQGRYNRISDVFHICASTGASLFLSGIILLFSPSKNYKICISILIIISAVILILLARFHSLQRMKFMESYKFIKSNDNSK